MLPSVGHFTQYVRLKKSPNSISPGGHVKTPLTKGAPCFVLIRFSVSASIAGSIQFLSAGCNVNNAGHEYSVLGVAGTTPPDTIADDACAADARAADATAEDALDAPSL
jgi:hypothetical protein